MSKPKCYDCCVIGEYNSQYDAYYCANCREWLEEICWDPLCEFCADRPIRPKHKWV